MTAACQNYSVSKLELFKLTRPSVATLLFLAMADALLTSQAVFRSRAIEVGFTEEAVEVAVSEGIASMGSFGFSTPFIPGLYYRKFIFFERPFKGLSKAFKSRTWPARRRTLERAGKVTF